MADVVGGRASLADQSLPARMGIVAATCLSAAVIGLLAGRSPKDAIGLTAVLAFIPIVVLRFPWGVGIFIVSTFLGISGTAQKGIGFLVILVAFGLLIYDRRGNVNFFAAHKGMTGLMLAFLAWSLLGATWATSTGDVTYSLSRYIPNFLVFFVVYAAVRDRRDVWLLAAFFVLGATVTAADAVLSPPSSSAFDTVSRAGSTFGDPNYTAAVLVTGFALSLALSRSRSLTVFGQAAAGVAAGLCLLGILLSVSRGGLIALGVALLAAICVAGRWRAKLAFAAIILALAGTGYFVLITPASTRDRLTSDAGGGSGRTTIWKVGWREVVNNPIKGVGAGNFSDAGAKYVIQPGLISHNTGNGYSAYFLDTPTVAHNTYLEVLAEEGIPGMCLFMALITAALVYMRRAAIRFRQSGDEQMELIAYGAFCGVLGFLAASFFLSEEYSKQLYLLLAMGPALLKVSPPLEIAATAQRAVRSRGRARQPRRRLPQPT